MEASMKEFIGRAGAEDYESVFGAVSLDDLVIMPAEDLENFLLDSVPKEKIRENIKKEISKEIWRKRDAKNGIQYVLTVEKREPEVLTIDEDDMDFNPKQYPLFDPRKKPKLEDDGMKEEYPEKNLPGFKTEEIPTSLETKDGKQEQEDTPRFNEVDRILKRLSNNPAPKPFTQQEKELITLQIVEKGKTVNLNGIFNLSWEGWITRHFDGSLHALHISKLSIQWHYPFKMALSEWLTCSLPNLKTLEVFDDVGVCDNHWDAVKSIITKASGGLEEVVFIFRGSNDFGLKQFLILLALLDSSYLKDLKVLRIQNKCKDVGLIAEYWGFLKDISAPSLEIIDLEVGFWMEEETVKNFQDMCQNFSQSLTTLIVHGCFYTDKKELPSVVIELPCMPKLKVLDMGQSCQLQKVVETLAERPKKKKKRKFVTIRQEKVDEESSQDVEMQDVEDEDDTYGNYFSVIFKLPHLESLESIKLSMLYEIQALHFSTFPNLKTFLVASEWNKTVRFPDHYSRKFLYKNIKELRFPNELEDPSFPPFALRHFPNLVSVLIELPTIDVVRSLAETLARTVEENPCPLLSKLEIRMQFHFLSSFEACILNEPWLNMRNEEELRQIAVLKEYVHWEDYVKVNKIHVPEYGETLNEDEGKRVILLPAEKQGKGLEALEGKLNAKKSKSNNLVFECIPHKLRLPKGTQHFNDNNCEFTNTLIGFDKNELPISKHVAVRIPGASLFKLFDISASWMYFDKEKRFSWKEDNIKVDPLQLTQKPEKEDKDIPRIRPPKSKRPSIIAPK